MASIEHEFEHLDHLIYLNHAAVAPWPRSVADAVERLADELATVGSQHYPTWVKTERNLKQQLARLINAGSADDIALVKNTSEALSLVAYGLHWQSGDNIVTSDEEFPANRIVWESLQRFGVELRQVRLSSSATPEDALFAAMDNRTRLLTISSVQYATGLRMDLERLGQHCRERGIYFCIDVIQSLGALPLDVMAINADFVAADSQKWLLGPEGLGIFYCRPELRAQLQLYQYGWHMVDPLGNYDVKSCQVTDSARRFEPGSPNRLGIHALEAATALLLQVGMDHIQKAVLDNSAYLIERIQANPHLELLTDPTPGRYAGIITFRPRHAEVSALHQYLISQNIICIPRGGGIRFSPHFYTPRSHLEKALNAVDDYLANTPSS
ncbi:MAG: aminotransferase class V-fold PLP-dependent enzyme [Gammaproteobacteria bacterium]|nr:aminotransferase class V-fold PLP-dependent enzyme [Gammaproteobacteria bacterium]